MGLFKRKTPEPEPAPPPTPWTPKVDMDSAKPVIWDLANINHEDTTDAQGRAAIVRWNLASGKPVDSMQIIRIMKTDPDVFNRPWLWLREAMKVSSENGDHETACAAFWWAFYWEKLLAPNLTSADYMDLGMNQAIPASARSDILAIGRQSATALPPDQKILGDSKGTITAEVVGQTAEALIEGR